MLPKRPLQSNGKIRAQALVEFTLTAMVLLLMLTLIIEVARIFQAYVTIQAAAREGARYAITGKWYEKYAGPSEDGDPAGFAARTSGWDPTSGDPFKKIPPCYPRFPKAIKWIDNTVHVSPTLTDALSVTLDNTASENYSEPYRDARTCTIEEVTIRRLTGLTLDAYSTVVKFDATDSYGGGPITTYSGPLMRNDKPYTFQVDVQGWSDEPEPSGEEYPHATENTYWNGTAWKDGGGGDPVWRLDDYGLQYPSGVAADPRLVHGYGGDPGTRVVVVVHYRLGFITPILNRMGSIPMTATAIMTNEAFGGTGVASNAVLPPPLVTDLELNPPDLPNLVVDSVTPNFSGRKEPNTDLTYNVKASNISGVDPTDVTAVRLYGVKTGLLADTTTTTLKNAITAGTAVLIGEKADLPTAWPIDVNVTVQFPDGGDWYVYAWIDSGEIVSEGDEEDNVNVTSSTADIGIDVDIEVTKTSDDYGPAAGSQFSYIVTAKNKGPAVAKDVRIQENVPGGLTLNSITPSAGTDLQPGNVWHIPTLNKNATATLTVTMTVPGGTANDTPFTNTASLLGVGGGATENDPTNNNGSATIRVGAVDMQLISKTVSPSTKPATGDVVTFTIQIKNLSKSVTATNVKVTDTLPAGLKWQANGSNCANDTSPAHTNAPSDQTVICRVGSMPPNQPAINVQFTATVGANTAGQSLTNTAHVSADGTDPFPGNNDGDVSLNVKNSEVEIIKYANVLWARDATGSTASTRYPFKYTVQVTNHGPDDAAAITVVDTIPITSGGTKRLVYQTDTSSQGSTSWNAGTGKLTWNVGALDNGDTATLTITVYADIGSAPALPASNTFTNTADITSVAPGDSDTSNNTASVNVKVTQADNADLHMSKTVSPSLAGPGQTVVYSLTVANFGPRTADNVKVTDTLLKAAVDNGWLQITGQSGPGTYNNSTGIWDVGTVAYGATATLNINVKVLGDSQSRTVPNTAAITASSKTDPNTADNSASASLQIKWPAAIWVNPGGSSCPSPITWGADDKGRLPSPAPVWAPSQPLGGNDWGIYGSSYTMLNPPSSTNFVDTDGTSLDAIGQSLMGCAVQGGNFYYRFNKLLPGVYKIYLVFADPYKNARQRRFTVDVTGGKKRKVLLNRFDIAKAIQGEGISNPSKSRDQVSGVWKVHYTVKTFTYTVISKYSYLNIHFYRCSKRLCGKVDTRALLSGIGIAFVSPP